MSTVSDGMHVDDEVPFNFCFAKNLIRALEKSLAIISVAAKTQDAAAAFMHGHRSGTRSRCRSQKPNLPCHFFFTVFLLLQPLLFAIS